jgi:hypothetical protein
VTEYKTSRKEKERKKSENMLTGRFTLLCSKDKNAEKINVENKNEYVGEDL